MMSALGALRRVMRLKIKKKSTTKSNTTKKATNTPKTPMDEPGSEKIKEAYLVMKHVQSMTMGDKLKNLVTAIVGNLGKLAKKKCTIGELESADCQKKSALACSTYALELLGSLSDDLVGKDNGCIQNAVRSLRVFIKKLAPA